MKASKSIGLAAFLAVSLLTAGCSSPASNDQASWNNHDWVDRAQTGASIHGDGPMVSNSGRGGD